MSSVLIVDDEPAICWAFREALTEDGHSVRVVPSGEEALRLGHDYIGTEHLLLGIIRENHGVAVKILLNLGVDLAGLKKTIEDTVRISGGTLTIGNIPLTKQAEKVLKITQIESKIYKSDVIGTEHILLSLLRDEDNVATQILNQFSRFFRRAADRRC